jgi:glycosyltransferase involved in cell wall biosynthesis
MKVALIHIRYIYKGGLETRLFNYIDYFLERGHEVHLFTSKVSEDVNPPANLHIHIINLKWIPKPIRNFFFDKKLKKVLKRKDFDFILSLERTSRQFHVIAPSTHKGYLVALNKYFYNFVDILQIYLDKKAFSSAKVVYACSEMVKSEIVAYYKISPTHVKVLYPPVNLKNFN